MPGTKGGNGHTTVKFQNTRDQEEISQTSRTKKEAKHKRSRVRCVSDFSTAILDAIEQCFKNFKGKGFFNQPVHVNVYSYSHCRVQYGNSLKKKNTQKNTTN